MSNGFYVFFAKFLYFYLDLVPFLFHLDKGKNGGSGEISQKHIKEFLNSCYTRFLGT